MQTDPNKKIPETITVSEFNKQVKDWTKKVQSRAKSRLRDATTGDSSGRGLRSITPSYKYDYGELFSTGFHFSYYLVFIHYGVGRGYVRKNGTVVRGRRDDNTKFMTYRNGIPAETWKSYENDKRPVRRFGFDWMDIEIRNNLEKLADIAVAYHGDKAAKEVMQQATKLLIDKT